MTDTQKQLRRAYSAEWYRKNKEAVKKRTAAYQREHKKKARLYRARYRARHAEKVHAAQSKYQKEHRPHLRAYAARYLNAHPEKHKAYQAAYRRTHRRECAMRKAAWAIAHADKRAEAQAKRQALKRGADKAETIRRKIVYERDGGRCHVCGRKVRPARWHLDHLLPLSKGGNHTYSNVAVSCPKCNMLKGPGRIDSQLRLIG